MKTSLLTVLLALAALQQPQTPAAAPLDAAQCMCSIEVVVMRAGTGAPIPDIELQLRVGVDRNSILNGTATAETGLRSVRTAASGRAEFRDLAEGTYTVLANRQGDFFIAGGPGNTVQSSIHVGPKEQRIQQVTFTMMTGGSVIGRILDAKHQPVRTGVSAFHVEYHEGQRFLVASLAEETDEHGKYRLMQLPAGEYYIRTISTAPQQNQTYYPGVLGPTSALPVAVHEGEELPGIDFEVPANQGVTISGIIINTFPGGDAQPDGQLLREISSLYLVPRDTGFYFDFPQPIPNTAKGSSNTNNGTEFPFEIQNVPPGTYDLYPLFVDTATNAHVNRYLSPTRIEVGSEDIGNIKAVIHGANTLKIRVSRNTSTSPQSAPRSATSSSYIKLRPKDSQPLQPPGSVTCCIPVELNSYIEIPNLLDGRFAVFWVENSVTGLPPGDYVADMRQGTQSVFDDGYFSISKDMPDTLELIIRSGGGAIQGKLDINGQDKSPQRVTVKLIPDPPRRQNLLLYKSVNILPDSNGTFSLTGIAPGSYKLFAWESLPSGAEQNAEFMSANESRGVSVTVSAGLTLSNIKAPLIPAQK